MSQDTLVHTGKKRHWSVFEKVLLALVLIFFVGFVVFVTLYANELSDDDDSDETKNTKGITRSYCFFLRIVIRIRNRIRPCRNSLGCSSNNSRFQVETELDFVAHQGQALHNLKPLPLSICHCHCHCFVISQDLLQPIQKSIDSYNSTQQ